jgi:hypothetical protein
MTTYEDYIADALEMVSAWELPTPEEVSEAANQQARIMAGLYLEPSSDSVLASPYVPLRF